VANRLEAAALAHRLQPRRSDSRVAGPPAQATRRDWSRRCPAPRGSSRHRSGLRVSVWGTQVVLGYARRGGPRPVGDGGRYGSMPVAAPAADAVL